MPVPNKGERVVVTARLPVAYYRKLDQYVKITGATKTSYLTDAIIRALDEVDIDTLHPDQERLDISA